MLLFYFGWGHFDRRINGFTVAGLFVGMGPEQERKDGSIDVAAQLCRGGKGLKQHCS